ncbi:MAG: sensor domain-containing diguanylate cyclase [Fusobacterium sp.]
MFLNNRISTFSIPILTLVNSKFLFAHDTFSKTNFNFKEYVLLGTIELIILSCLLILSLFLLILLNYKLRKTKDNLTIALKNLEESKQRFLDVTNAAEAVVWEIGRDSKFNYISNKIEKILGYSPEELFETSVYNILKEKEKENFLIEILKSIKEKEKLYKRKYKFIHKNNHEIWLQISGVPIYDEYNKFMGFRGVLNDITREHHRECKLNILARSDALTGLMNRRYFLEESRKYLESNILEEKDFSYAMVDIDYFKNINDTYGHDAGDKVLRELAILMKEVSKGECLIIGRLGGEEFAYAFPNTNIKIAKQLMIDLQNKINHHAFIVNGKKIFISVSVGISYLNEENKTLDGLNKASDIALYKGKNNGRNRIEVQKK